MNGEAFTFARVSFKLPGIAPYYGKIEGERLVMPDVEGQSSGYPYVGLNPMPDFTERLLFLESIEPLKYSVLFDKPVQRLNGESLLSFYRKYNIPDYSDKLRKGLDKIKEVLIAQAVMIIEGGIRCKGNIGEMQPELFKKLFYFKNGKFEVLGPQDTYFTSNWTLEDIARFHSEQNPGAKTILEYIGIVIARTHYGIERFSLLGVDPL